MKYQVFLTEHASKDMQDIFDYIAISLESEQSAINQLDRLIKAIESLDEMPQRHHKYCKEPWSSRNLRIMLVGNYLVFYIPDTEDKIVTVIRIMYKRRNIDEQLKDIDGKEEK